jgi:diketogulonate reductase-like aldo/keto reductase
MEMRLRSVAMHVIGASAEEASTVALSNGAEMPLVGYGCALFGLKTGFDFAAFPNTGDGTDSNGDDAIEQMAGQVLDAGYRHLDTAHCYHSELPVGRALAQRFASGSLSRGDVWVTTKTSDPILRSNDYMRDQGLDAEAGVLDRAQQIGSSGGSLEPPGPLS